MIVDLTPGEKRVVDLLREMKKRTGHGQLLVDVVNGKEEAYLPTFREKAPR